MSKLFLAMFMNRVSAGQLVCVLKGFVVSFIKEVARGVFNELNLVELEKIC